MRAYILASLILLCGTTAFANDDLVEVNRKVTVQTVTASSAFSEQHSCSHIADDSGMTGDRHDNQGNSTTMWHSVIDPPSSRAEPNTPEGPAWVRFDFQRPEAISLIRVWNHNQRALTDRGLKKVYLSASEDGANWRELQLDNKGFVVIPRASGAGSEPASISIGTDSKPIKHLVITADAAEGNYGGNVYGLSEVRFYSSSKVKYSDLPMPDDMEITTGRAFLRRNDGKAGLEATIALKGEKLYGGATLNITSGDVSETTYIIADPAGCDELSIVLPAGIGTEKERAVRFQLEGRQKVLEKTINVAPRRQWTVYIYPHSHVDIGYTAPQDIVKKLHMRNIDVGMDIAKKTADYPDGAKYVWNPEVNWAVESYLAQADPEKKEAFVKAVNEGRLALNASFGNINTSTASDEELLRLFDYCHYLRKLTGAPIDTMVQFDVPGASWGIAQAAAQNGVRGFFLFPNNSARIGTARVTWDQKAFYWVARDGKTRIFFMQGEPYGSGYIIKGSPVYGLWRIISYNEKEDRLSTDDPTAFFLDPFIFNETARLEAAEHPYDIFVMTWAMADNALIDADLPEAVRLWNDKYAYPKLIIAGTHEIMTQFEKRYSSIIPEVQGDYTEYWTDGQGADARRIGMNREAKERLVQAETLWTMLHRDQAAPREEFYQSWRYVLLGDEHTWGYLNPSAPIAKQIEAVKASFFDSADKTSRALLKKTLEPVSKPGSSSIAVLNSQSWKRSGLITLSASQSKAGDCVLNDQKQKVPSQRLTTGELAFWVSDIPALGSRLYEVTDVAPPKAGGCKAAAHSIENELVRIKLDPKSGNISNLLDLRNGRDYVDGKSKFGMNAYYYLPGTDLNQLSTATNVRVTVKENGPLVASLVVESKGQGCNAVTRELRVIAGQPHVELINTLDKIATRAKEGVHFGFPFNVPGGTVRMDIPWGIMTPEKDQLPGGNRNWLAIQRWIDVSNADSGVTWVSMEAPLVQFGNITANILGGANGSPAWLQSLPKTETFLSWALNNHWHTNFPLQQGGIIRFRYKILPHGSYDPVAAQRFALDSTQPLIAVPAAQNPVKTPLLSIDNPSVFLSTMKPSNDGKAVILRLRCLSDKEEHVRIGWLAARPANLNLSDASEKPGKELEPESALLILPHGALTVRVTFE